YNRVAAFARDWKVARQREQRTTGRGVFVPLAFSTGEAFQFDWSEDWAVIGGERTKLQVAHFKTSYSRPFVLRAYPQQTHEMLFDTHNHAFRVLGGVPRRGIYDNMRTAVETRQEPPGQRTVRRHDQPLPVRGGVLQPSFRLGERADREERPRRSPSARQPTPSFTSLAALND